jgi:hypothetical protein
MVMARAKPRFACEKCGDMGSAATSAKHFQEHPSHRTERQQKDYESNQALREKKRSGVKRRSYKQKKAYRRRKLHKIGDLPTVKVDVRGRRMKAVRTMKHCTDCGTQRKATHRYCGGCGEKL